MLMKLICWLIVCGVIGFQMTALLTSSVHANWRQGSVEKSKQEVLDLEKHWLEVENDPEALETVLAPDFLHVVPAGIITKNEQLNFMRQHSSPEHSSRHFEDMHVRVYGSVAIVNGIVVATDARGTHKTLFTDVFAYREGKWQAVNAQELPASETSH
jgi:hypothetical protein